MKNIAVITGASSGIGREFAKQIARKYSKMDELWIIARREERLQELQTELSVKFRMASRILVLDLSNPEDIKQLTAQLHKEKPHVRMLVNAAGYGRVGRFEMGSRQDQLGMIRLNCEALTSITYSVLPYMNDRCRIINMASVAAFLPQPELNVYAATKSFVLSFSRALAYEIRGRHISVTAVCPGPVATEFFSLADPKEQGGFYKKLFMADPVLVVRKALLDASKGRQMSVYSLSMNLILAASKTIPHRLILDLLYR